MSRNRARENVAETKTLTSKGIDKSKRYMANQSTTVGGINKRDDMKRKLSTIMLPLAARTAPCRDVMKTEASMSVCYQPLSAAEKRNSVPTKREIKRAVARSQP